MAVKRKLLECECGEVFVEGHQSHLTGNLKYSPWSYRNHRLRATKSPSGGDILAALFERSVFCGKCGQELLREKRQYELTPPVNPNKPEPVPSYSTRALVVRSNAPVPAVNSGVNLGKQQDEGIISVAVPQDEYFEETGKVADR